MSTAIEQFEALNGRVVSLDEIQQVLNQAKKENNTDLVYRLSRALEDCKDETRIEVNIKKYPNQLNAPRHTGDYREALDDCGRLRKGWKFVKGNVVKVEKKEKKEVSKPKKQGIKNTENQEETFIKYVLPLYEERKANPDKKLSVKESKDSFFVESKEFWKVFKNIQTDYVKTQHLRGIIKILPKGFEMLEKNCKTCEKSDFEQVVEPKKTTTNDTKQKTKEEKLIAEFKKNVSDYYTEVQKKYLAEKEAFIDRIKTNYKQHLELIIKNIIFHLENKPESIESFINERINEYNTGDYKEKIIIFDKNSFSGISVRNRAESEVYYDVYLNEVVPFFEKKNFLRKGKELDIELKAIKDIVDYRYKKGESIYIDDAVPLYFLFRDNKKIDSDLMIFDTEAEQYLNKYVEYAGGYNIELNDKGKDLLTSIKNRVESLKNQKYNYSLFDGLSAPQPQLTTEDFKKMSVKELREFTLQYYLQNLKGKTAIIKKYLKEVVFTTQAGRKISKGEAMYSAKAVAVTHLQELIENSTYNNWGDRKKKDSKDVLGYLNFKSKFILDEEKKHLRISLVMYRDRRTELKDVEVGKKEKSDKFTQAPVVNSETTEFNRFSKDKPTKKSSTDQKNNKKSGLAAPNPLIIPMNTELPEVELFNIGGDFGKFLGSVERKPVGSVAITLDAPQGAGKTRFLFYAMNQIAGAGYRCLFVSLEEHPMSELFQQKKEKYIDPQNLGMIDTIGELPNGYDDLQNVIDHYDWIFIDSWGKLSEITPVDFDRDFRKKYNGKGLFVIFQRTVNNTMRGGSRFQFDGDIIMKIHKDKDGDFKNNYAYFDKNRYQSTELHLLKFNTYTHKLMTDA